MSVALAAARELRTKLDVADPAVESDAIVNACSASVADGLPPFFAEAALQLRCGDSGSNNDDSELGTKLWERVGTNLNTNDRCPTQLRRFFWPGLAEGSLKSKIMAAHPVGSAGLAMLLPQFKKLWDLHVGPIYSAGTSKAAPLPEWHKQLRTKINDPNRESRPQPLCTAESDSDNPVGSVPSPLDGATTISIKDDISWESVSAVRAIAGGLGSSGVFVVVLEAGGAIVLKPASASNLCGELFGTLVMKYFGIPCPDCRVVPQDQILPINRGLRKSPAAFTSPEEQSVLWQRFKKGHGVWLLQQFAKGRNAWAVSTEILNIGQVLRQLGRVAAVDAVLNNYDRIPVVHSNNGNAANWLIDDDGTVHPIDQSTSRIVAGPGRERYIESVKGLAREAWTGTPGPCCLRLQEHLSVTVGWSVDGNEQVLFLEGVKEIAARLRELDSKCLTELKADVEKQFYASPLPPWLLGDQLASIDLDFVTACAAALGAPPSAD